MSSGSVVPPGTTRRRWRVGPILWALVPALSLGLLAPVPFAHAAVRLRQRRLWAVTAAYAIGSLVELVVAAAPAGGRGDLVLGPVVLALMIVGTTHALVLRRRVFTSLPAEPATALAASNRREDAGAVATGEVALAGGLADGLSEPPRQVDDGGLVDVNHAPAQVLVDRLGLSPAQAGQVVQARERRGGFAGPEELIAGSGLPEATVNALRERLLFVAVERAMDPHGDLPETTAPEDGKDVPPGWYPDPAGGQGLRYWDGGRWTDLVAAPPTRPSGVKRGWLVAVIVAVVAAVTVAVIVAIVVVGGGSQPSQTEVAAPGGTRVRTLDVGHKGNVVSIVFSPDGKLVATASYDETVRLWDAATAKTVQTLPIGIHGSLPLAFSPDGRLLATAGGFRAVLLWDASTGQTVATLPEHPGPVTDVVFAPDGRTFATTNADGPVRLWRVGSGTTVTTLTSIPGAGSPLAYSPDGRLLAVGTGVRGIQLVTVATGEATATLSGHSAAVTSLAFSPDGKQLASGAADGKALLWRVATSRATDVAALDDWVESVAFSPDGRLLAVGGGDGVVRLWDISTRTMTLALTGRLKTVGAGLGFAGGQLGRIEDLAFSPDGSTIAIADDYPTVRLWRLR